MRNEALVELIAELKMAAAASKIGVPVGLGLGIVVTQVQERPTGILRLFDVPSELIFGVILICVVSFIAHFVFGWMFKRIGELGYELFGWFVRAAIYVFFLAMTVLLANMLSLQFDTTGSWLMVGAFFAVGATEFVFWVRFIIGSDKRARETFKTMIRLRKLKKAIEDDAGDDAERILLGKEPDPQSDNQTGTTPDA